MWLVSGLLSRWRPAASCERAASLLSLHSHNATCHQIPQPQRQKAGGEMVGGVSRGRQCVKSHGKVDAAVDGESRTRVCTSRSMARLGGVAESQKPKRACRNLKSNANAPSCRLLLVAKKNRMLSLKTAGQNGGPYTAVFCPVCRCVLPACDSLLWLCLGCELKMHPYFLLRRSRRPLRLGLPTSSF